MITSKISINGIKDIIEIGAVRLFPVSPLQPRKGRVAFYQCGEVINGKINDTNTFHIWYKYGDGLELMSKVIREYLQIRKHGLQKYHAGFYTEPNFEKELIHYAGGRPHCITGPVQVEPYKARTPVWVIGGNRYYNEEDFINALKKYQPKPDVNLIYQMLANELKFESLNPALTITKS